MNPPLTVNFCARPNRSGIGTACCQHTGPGTEAVLAPHTAGNHSGAVIRRPLTPVSPAPLGAALEAATRGRERLDVALARLGYVATRSQARDLIKRGQVTVNGTVETRPGTVLAPDARIALAEGAGSHVSRAGVKLEHALDHFGFDPHRRASLDVGASTGGFTAVLLGRGARVVYAVDVGRDQLSARLRNDLRVVSHEGLDARALTPSHIPEPIGAITADTSFISLKLVLGVPLAFASPGAFLVALVKPQFEAGREAIGKGGIVRKEADRQHAVERVATWLAAQPGWRIRGVTPSPITGGSGNVEYLLGAVFRSKDERD